MIVKEAVSQDLLDCESNPPRPNNQATYICFLSKIIRNSYSISISY